MKSEAGLWINRTGSGAAAPEWLGSLYELARASQPGATNDGENAQDGKRIGRVRIMFADAGPTGSLPPPRPLSEPGSGAADNRAAAMLVFADKLGERLAFERAGVRLYDALIAKLDAHGSWPGGPSRLDLEEIRMQEHEHYLLLSETVAALGEDPKAVTRSANLHAVVSLGLPIALTDPRTNLRDGLEAILVAELVDNDGWENLSELARGLGRDNLVEAFAAAVVDEREHLRRVRAWMAAGLVPCVPRGRDEGDGRLEGHDLDEHPDRQHRQHRQDDGFLALVLEREREQLARRQGDDRGQRPHPQPVPVPAPPDAPAGQAATGAALAGRTPWAKSPASKRPAGQRSVTAQPAKAAARAPKAASLGAAPAKRMGAGKQQPANRRGRRR